MMTAIWPLKVVAKVALSRLPMPGLLWQRLHLFRAGSMDVEAYAKSVFDTHFAASGLNNLTGKTVLEIGPGNGLLSARYAAEVGAEHTWLIDASRLSSTRPESHATYLTNGLESLRTMPASSIDFLFSHAVLEHVRLFEFEDVIRETRRILKPDGIASHLIDFRDHLANALNNLRFSERSWEGKLLSSSGFYTNRIPWPSMKGIFEQSGFSVQEWRVNRWTELPTPHKSMAEPFRSMPPESLLCRDCHAVLRPSMLGN